jgi:peptide/nickel transport system ATP-binding protein
MVMYAGSMVEGGQSEEIMGSAAHPYTQLLLSAVPDPRAGLHTRKDMEARGEVPSLIDPPGGCPFAARCTKVMDVCRQVMPGRTALSRDHWVRCHLYGPGENHPISQGG